MLCNENKGFIYGFIAVVSFGLTLPFSKELLDYMNPLFIAFGRALVASIFAIVFLLIWGSFPTVRQFIQLCLIALGVVIGFPLFSTIAMQTIPASHGAIMVGILPLATSIAGMFFTRERPSFKFWLFGILGSMLVISFALLEGGGSFQSGDWFLFIAIFMVSIGYALGARLAKEMAGWEVISWSLVLSIPFIVIPTFWYMPHDIKTLPISSYVYFLYLGIVSQLFAFFAWYKGLALGGIIRVSQIQLLQTFVTLFVSSILLDERISILMVIFTVLIIVTVWIGKKMPIKNI